MTGIQKYFRTVPVWALSFLFLLSPASREAGLLGQTIPEPPSVAEVAAAARPHESFDPAAGGGGLAIAPAPQPAPARQANEWSGLASNILQDQKDIWTRPFRITKEDARFWLILGGATGALVATDRFTATKLPNSSDQVAVGTWTSRAGAIYTLAPLAAGMYGIGRLTDNPRARETGLIGLEALASGFLVNSALKAVTQRERPTEGAEQGHFWKGRGRLWNSGSSFPSGHSMNAWALASVFAHQYSDKKWVPFVAYGLASTVSASRMAARKHYASDVVLGAAIGWFIGRYVYQKRHNPEIPGRKPGVRSWLSEHVTIQPSFGGVPPGAMRGTWP